MSKQKEPGGIIPGTRTYKRTPLAELGAPTPLPYEVAPPEAQYGSIGLILIFAGAVVYYRLKPRTTRSLIVSQNRKREKKTRRANSRIQRKFKKPRKTRTRRPKK